MYVDSVAMLSQIIEFTENNTDEQTREVLSTCNSKLLSRTGDICEWIQCDHKYNRKISVDLKI